MDVRCPHHRYLYPSFGTENSQISIHIIKASVQVTRGSKPKKIQEIRTKARKYVYAEETASLAGLLLYAFIERIPTLAIMYVPMVVW